MTPFRWTLLCLLFTLYLLFGGSIFMLIEQHHEIHQKEELHVLRQDIQEILFRLDRNFYDNTTSPDILDALTSAKEGVVNRIAQVCQIDNLLEGPTPDTASLKWNYYNSVFFAFTVVTTIGYGHLSPSTSLAKGLMIIYALFGIPLNGILLSGIGDYFSNKIIKVHQKSKDKKYRGKSLTLVFEIMFYLVPGIIVFIIIPAGIFVLIENWTFLDSIYYAFVSLTTIGFGDYVAGMGDGHNVWLWLYKAFIIIWITFGLGYLIMILGFIAKGMKSKKVRGILDKRLSGIRNTKEKLSKDIDYMRRIVNELYMMKIKPAYDVNGVEDGEDPISDKFGNSVPGRLRTRKPSCVRFERRCSSLPKLVVGEAGKTNQAFEDDDGKQVVTSTSSSTTKVQPKSILKRRLSDSAINQLEWDDSLDNLRRGSISPEEMLDAVVNALSGNMQNVIDAVDELNKYEEEVENDPHLHGHEESEGSPDEDEKSDSTRKRNRGDIENGLVSLPKKGESINHLSHSWDLSKVPESDEEGLLDGGLKTEQKLECVVIHNKSNGEDVVDGPTGQAPAKGPTQSFIEKVGDAFRKISGTGTPPETPSRKISRNESDARKRKISHEPERSFSGLRCPNQFQYGSFSCRSPSTLSRQKHSTSEQPDFSQTDFHSPYSPYSHVPQHHQYGHGMKHFSLSPHTNAEDLRKISQESHFSSMSTSSYQTIDEIITSARATRKNTPAHYHPSSPHPPLIEGDVVDGAGGANDGRMSIESSTSSLVHFLKALDNVQDRLKKNSTCSDASFSDSYCYSDDLSNSFGPSSSAKSISSRKSAFKRTVIPVQGKNRRRKNGIFQPGFSYSNFGYEGEEEEEEEIAAGISGSVVASTEEFSKSNGVSLAANHSTMSNGSANGSGSNYSNTIKKR